MLATFRVYFERRVFSMLFFGFSSGLPLLLVFSTLSAWLAESGVSKTAIGFASLIGTAYALKYLWSPLVDKLPLPYLSRRLGQRRAWMLLSQVAIIFSLIVLSRTDPEVSLATVVMAAVLVAFSSATQDIVVDAYRTEILQTNRLGAGAANLVLGYRVGMLSASAGILILADYVGWQNAYLAMAVLGGVGIFATLLNPEPEPQETPESRELKRYGQEKLLGGKASPFGRLMLWFYDAVVCPFAEFLKRRGVLSAVILLAFIMLYKYSDALLGVMAKPFYLEIGFTKSEIGVVVGGWGLAMTLCGAIIGGFLVRKYGILNSLVICAIAQSLSNLAFIALAYEGANLNLFAAVIAVDNISGGMGTTAFVAFLSFLCNRAYTATQYALLSSLFAFGRTLFAAGGGVLADHVSWPLFFSLTVLAGVPGLVLLYVLRRARILQEEKTEEST